MIKFLNVLQVLLEVGQSMRYDQKIVVITPRDAENLYVSCDIWSRDKDVSWGICTSVHVCKTLFSQLETKNWTFWLISGRWKFSKILHFLVFILFFGTLSLKLKSIIRTPKCQNASMNRFPCGFSTELRIWHVLKLFLHNYSGSEWFEMQLIILPFKVP